MNKICFLIPFYGSLPSYIFIFFKSIANKPFDIFIFTDLKAPIDTPINVSWNYLSLEKLNFLISEKLSVEFKINNPYKLCDLKPMYGLVFENYINNYDFWGTIDVDTIMGNFSRFITNNTLDEIDIYSGIREYVSGSLFLMRNNIICNNLFKKSRDWLYVLQNKEYCGFDECGGHYFKHLKEGKSIFELQTPIQSITEIIFLEAKKDLRVLFENSILEPKGVNPVLINEKGIFYKKEEYIMLHYIYYKTKYYFQINLSVQNTPYFINEMGIFKEEPTFLRILFSINLLKRIIVKFKINFRKLNIKQNVTKTNIQQD